MVSPTGGGALRDCKIKVRKSVLNRFCFPEGRRAKVKTETKRTKKTHKLMNEWNLLRLSSLFFFSIEQTAELGVLTCCSPYNPSSHLINLCARTACIYNSVGWISPAKLFAIAPFMQCVSAYTQWVYGNPQTFKPLLHISDAQHKYRRILLPPPEKNV